ncbi:hypothetical protein [Streptacidiphilus sp. EB103A]|uniref:hypothetical protein n=1 Tax=Streptacidiphilus sp. EB103A TaxID=3156275 RepID=UPI00351145B0
MTQPAIRPDVVARIAGLNLTGGTATWTRQDGSPATQDDIDAVMNSTWAELEAVRDFHQRAADHLKEQGGAAERIAEITRPYFATLPEGATMGDVAPLLTDAERDEVNRLAALIAPDGTVIVTRQN